MSSVVKIVISLGVVAVVGLAVMYWFSPENYGFYPRCPLFALTGLQCAGCGALRAMHAMLHGDFVQAFRFNPLLFVAVPFLIVLLFKPALAMNRFVAWSAVIVAVVYSICRNLV